MISFIKELFQQRDYAPVHAHPSIHNFPNVGPNGEITISCIITPGARAAAEHTMIDEQANGRGQRITTKRVGTIEIELDELGLCFKWKPAQIGDEFMRQPSMNKPRPQPTAKPAKNRGDDDHIQPLERTEFDVQAGPPPSC